MRQRPKVRGGIVGPGFAANLHRHNIARVGGVDVDLVGVFSPTVANAKRFAGTHGLQHFASLDELLDAVEVVRKPTAEPAGQRFFDDGMHAAGKCGGGSLIGKAVHPLMAALYLKGRRGARTHGPPDQTPGRHRL